jgi:hypothetical protein
VALGQQPLHDQAAGPLDGDRQPGRLAKLAQAAEDGEQAASLCSTLVWKTILPSRSMTVTSWLSLAQSQPTYMGRPPSWRGTMTMTPVLRAEAGSSLVGRLRGMYPMPV